MCRGFDSLPVHKTVSFELSDTVCFSHLSHVLVDNRVNTPILGPSLTFMITASSSSDNWDQLGMVWNASGSGANHRPMCRSTLFLRMRPSVLGHAVEVLGNRVDARCFRFRLTPVEGRDTFPPHTTRALTRSRSRCAAERCSAYNRGCGSLDINERIDNCSGVSQPHTCYPLISMSKKSRRLI